MYCAQGASHSTKTLAASTKNAIAFVTCSVFSGGKSPFNIRTYLALLGRQIFIFSIFKNFHAIVRNFRF